MPLYDFNDLIKTAQESKPQQNYARLEPGDYEFVIDEVPTVNNEKHYLSVKAKVASGDRANYVHFHTVSFKPDIKPFAAKQTLDFLTACGISPDQLQQAGSLENIANGLINKRFTATAEKDIDQYKMDRREASDTKEYFRNQLRDFRPSASSPGPGGPGGLGSGPGVPSPSAPAQQAPQAAQADPWAPAPTTPPAQGNGPQTNFQAPPMPFGNNG